MPSSESEWPLVSALFITYKRVHLLEKAVHSFLQHTDYPNLELVIADDGSGPVIQERIRHLPADVFALSPRNRGLGPNNNNGIRHCTGKYILMIQDDWQCSGPSDYLKQSILVMEANPGLGIINYCGAAHSPDLKLRLTGSTEPCYLTPKPLQNPDKQEYLYSDQPHLISREAQDFIGPYIYHRQIENSEKDYCERWKAQTKYGAAFFPAYRHHVFSNHGIDLSFRASRARYRIGNRLQVLQPFLPKRAVRIGKAIVMSTVYFLEKIRVLR